ncbi:hypothetical protein [Paraburkholderia fynbosensis]|uniref:hypothetical protein n=1 Tax=Paraburkholderia fynbosensis TaxID=1200993 RepID=UPI0015840995|nr:hypothetical protein [Paraburkholderia fynbosensis]
MPGDLPGCLAGIDPIGNASITLCLATPVHRTSQLLDLRAILRVAAVTCHLQYGPLPPGIHGEMHFRAFATLRAIGANAPWCSTADQPARHIPSFTQIVPALHAVFSHKEARHPASRTARLKACAALGHE